MDKILLVIFLCLFVVAIATAIPSQGSDLKERFRGKLLTQMKRAWIDMFKTLANAGNSVVHLFRPVTTTKKPLLTTTTEDYDF